VASCAESAVAGHVEEFRRQAVHVSHRPLSSTRQYGILEPEGGLPGYAEASALNPVDPTVSQPGPQAFYCGKRFVSALLLILKIDQTAVSHLRAVR